VFSRLTITSGLMLGYVTVSQVLATSIEIRFLVAEFKSPFFSFLITVYSIWNLDFFRSFYTPFCLHPNMSPLAVIALDYAVALYPLFLIVIAYVILIACERYKQVICCWLPFYRAIHRCYQAFNVHNSVVDAFITVLIISYVKILNTTFELLLQVKLVGSDNRVMERAVFYSGSLKYFQSNHLPYAAFALLISLVVNILPVILMTLYPCQCVQKYLKVGACIHNVMDNFYRPYKITPKDHRWFAVLFLYLRIVNLLLLEVTLSPVYFSLVAIQYLIMALLIGLIQPFKSCFHNIVNALLFSVTAIIKIMECAVSSTTQIYQDHTASFFYTVILLYLVPPLYGLIVLLYHIMPERWVKSLLRKVSVKVQRIRGTRLHEESFAHRLSHANEYSPLITVYS